MTVFIFPGQGSQKKGMGENLFDKYKELTEISDSILGYSIEKLCTEDPENNLGLTQYTQPSLFIVNAMMYLDTIDKQEIEPDYVAGHSLGEYNALFASGAFDFTTGLKLTRQRGELMSHAKGGGMAAIIGLNHSSIDSILQENKLDAISIANYNTPLQIVITGPEADIIKSQSLFENAGAKMFIPLKVSGAFHSPYMNQAAKEFSEFIDQFVFHDLKIQVISNLDAIPYKPDRIKETLVGQITSAVRWTESMNYLLNKGETDFIETGPGRVLTGLLKQNFKR